MADGTYEHRITVLEGAVNTIDKALNGQDNQDGIVQQVAHIVAYVKYQEGLEAGARAARKRAIAVFIFALTTLGSLAGWGINHLWNIVAPPAAAIIEEYWEHHPQGKVAPKEIHPPGSSAVYSVHNRAPQDAGIRSQSQ